jgi:hypothetical protein
MLRLGFALAFCAAALTGCSKPIFQNDLSFVKDGNEYDFRVSVVKDMLYISCKYNGADIGGDYGRSIAGSIAQVAVKDLNSDGYPELYVFYDGSSPVPDITAITCNERACSGIGVLGAVGGPGPENYCGDDSYSIENNLVIRKYRLCRTPSPTGAGFGAMAYTLGRNSFGYILNLADAPVRTVSN